MFQTRLLVAIIGLMVQTAAGLPCCLAAQDQPKMHSAETPVPSSKETVRDYNVLLQRLDQAAERRASNSLKQEYRIGSSDLLEVSVLEAPDLGRSVRVSESGEVSLPLLGIVHAAGLTAHEEETVLEELLRRTYMNDPHVSVFVKEMESHSVSVFGAVRKPGVLQIRGAKTLIEILSMAEGLADDAGDTVLVSHRTWSGKAFEPPVPTQDANPMKPGFGPELEPAMENGGNKVLLESNSDEINLKSLLESRDPHFNVLVYPGDIVKVVRAGVVYVIGEVRRPGGFQLKTNENISVLQAIALAEGLTHTSAKSHARIIRTDESTGRRKEMRINLSKVLSGKASDPILESHDILFIPNSAGRSALYRGMEAALSVGTGLAVYRR